MRRAFTGGPVHTRADRARRVMTVKGAAGDGGHKNEASASSSATHGSNSVDVCWVISKLSGVHTASCTRGS